MFPKNPYINQQVIVDGVSYTYTSFGWRFTSSLAATSKEEVDGESVEIVSGKDGKDGAAGITPEINSSGEWQIGNTSTGVQAQGPRGYSIQYQWNDTYLGIKTENEPVYSYVDLKGPQGDQGPQGIQGEKGEPGDATNAVSELERTNWNAAYAWGDHSDQGYLTTTPDYSEIYHPFSGLSTLDFKSKVLRSKTLVLPTITPSDLDALEAGIYLGDSGFTGELPTVFNPNLGDLADINFSNLADNDTLVYNLATQKFINAPLPSGSGALSWNNITGKPTEFPPVDHTHPMSEISDIGDIAGVNKSNSTSQFLRGDGVWASPPTSSYSVMNTSEGQTATSTTGRLMRADYLKQIILHHSPAGSRPASDVYSWAKQSSKPSYTNEEVGAAATNGDITKNFSVNNLTAQGLILNGYTLTIE